MKLINIAALVDQYIERQNDSEFGFTDSPIYPDLYSITACGKEWLTDRYWLLPRDLCDLGGAKFDVRALPESNVQRTEGWIRHLSSNTLTPSDARFSATFAGVLTLAGLAAMSIDGQPAMNALVYTGDGSEERIGVITPVRVVPGTDMSRYTTLPVSAECLAMHSRLSAARIVDDWQCWDLAAYLTNTGAES